VLEALQNEDDIDLVLLDLPMPGNHGLAGLAADPRATAPTPA
jgi:CheY-like chemotaxis protein